MRICSWVSGTSAVMRNSEVTRRRDLRYLIRRARPVMLITTTVTYA